MRSSDFLWVCVCVRARVCVCVWERERERELSLFSRSRDESCYCCWKLKQKCSFVVIHVTRVSSHPSTISLPWTILNHLDLLKGKVLCIEKPSLLRHGHVSCWRVFCFVFFSAFFFFFFFLFFSPFLTEPLCWVCAILSNCQFLQCQSRTKQHP